ncbi:hypothetical protein EHQ43_14255 [Leptospira bouyouniensis]|uniref:Uncharacterized protein n=1 Tax=Leptospira bouyouniensis TaxID=2484911 RepID=A0A7I0HR26_9LEPT|nr:hypothetical protein EHQ43_14255 [Leptospira bouyouniensis]
MINKEYIKKLVHLPYGQSLIQIFELSGSQILRAICFNQHTQKYFLFDQLTSFPYLKSNSDIQSSEKEFKQFESNL